MNLHCAPVVADASETCSIKVSVDGDGGIAVHNYTAEAVLIFVIATALYFSVDLGVGDRVDYVRRSSVASCYSCTPSFLSTFLSLLG